MTSPPSLPGLSPPTPEARAAIVRPHRAQKILILGVLGFVFAPCGFVAVWLGRRDLRAMAAGTMDRTGEPLTKLGRMLGIVAGIMWAIKWAILCVLAVIVYLNWTWISQQL